VARNLEINEMEAGTLVVLGSINADHILNIEQLPNPVKP